MTQKAQDILKRMRGWKRRDRVLQEFNSSTLDDVGPVGGDKGEKFLSELNEMADLENQAGQKGSSG